MARQKGASHIAQLLKREFPSAVFLRQGAICKAEPIHLLEGIQIEPTSISKRYYAWSFVAPLCLSPTLPKLNYGRRLNNGIAYEGSDLDIAEKVLNDLASSSDRSRLTGNEMTLSFFLENCFHGIDIWHNHNTVALIDYAVALTLIGQDFEAKRCFRKVLEHLLPDPENGLWLALQAIEKELDGQGDPRAVIAKLENEGRERLGLVRLADAPPH